MMQSSKEERGVTKPLLDISSMEEVAEPGVTTPLLDTEGLKKQYTEDGSLDIHGRPALRLKTGNWQAAAIILGVATFETIAYYGISTNLVMYLSKIFHGGNGSVAASFSNWAGTSNFTPLLGALIADSCWGRYRTVLVSFLMCLVGMVVITVSASLLPSCEGTSCPKVPNFQKLAFFFGLYFVAFASGSIKSSLIPFGGDQFEEGNPIERVRKESYFSWYFLFFGLGQLISGTVIVWIQEEVNWGLGYGIATLSLAIALGAFISGTSIYRLQRPSGSPLKRILQVLVASFRNRRLEVPVNSCNLYEMRDRCSDTQGSRMLQHTDEFKFLDKAAIISELDAENGFVEVPGKLCTVTQVEELKILLRLLPLWASGVIYSAAVAQGSTVFLEQGNVMNTKIGTFSVLPANLKTYGTLNVVFLIFIFSMIAKRNVGNGLGISQLQKMGFGCFVMIVLMSIAALVESQRLISVRNGNVMSIAWQLPQYFLMGVSELFYFLGMLDFFYSQAPDTMRSTCTAFVSLSVSGGNFLYSYIISLVTSLTGWLPNNLNDGHLDYFCWTMAALSTLNFVVHLACARRYKLKKSLVVA